MAEIQTHTKGQKISEKKMVSWILPKNERWGIFMYWKLPQRSLFGRIQDAIICFWDLLTFSKYTGPRFYSYKTSTMFMKHPCMYNVQIIHG